MQRQAMRSREFERLRVLGAGIISLVLMLGIARFAYTPLLPLMQQQAGLGAAEGGWLAARSLSSWGNSPCSERGIAVSP